MDIDLQALGSPSGGVAPLNLISEVFVCVCVCVCVLVVITIILIVCVLLCQRRLQSCPHPVPEGSRI